MNERLRLDWGSATFHRGLPEPGRVVDGQTVFVTDFVGEAETKGPEVEQVAKPANGVRLGFDLHGPGRRRHQARCSPE